MRALLKLDSSIQFDDKTPILDVLKDYRNAHGPASGAESEAVDDVFVTQMEAHVECLNSCGLPVSRIPSRAEVLFQGDAVSVASTEPHQDSVSMPSMSAELMNESAESYTSDLVESSRMRLVLEPKSHPEDGHWD